MENKLVNEHIDPLLLIGSLYMRQLCEECSVILLKGAAEDHIDRSSLHLTFKTLFYDVRRKLKLAQSNEISGNHAEDLIIAE